MPNYNNKYSGMDFRQRNDSKQTDSLSRFFSRSPAYFEVIKYNNDNTNIVDFPIQIYNSVKSGIGKKFISHPSYDLVYGDIVKESDDYYIVYDIKENNHINYEGELKLCDTQIKWEQTGRILEQYCYSESSNVSNDDDKNVNLLSGKLKLYIPNNVNTINIYENQRFIIGNDKLKPYKVESINDFSKKGMLIISLAIDEFNEQDDLENKIAYNHSNIVANLIDSTVDDSYYIVSPETMKVRYDEIIDVSVMHYDSSNVVIATNFTYTITDINVSDYELITVDENNITIKSNNFPNEGKLNIKNEDNGETLQVDITFVGLW